MKKLALITVILAFAANIFAAGVGIAGGGRINKTNTGYEITYFITDHLGSTRVITDANGSIKEQNDYYPFGKKHENPNLMTSTNRWGFSGKEKQTTSDINYMDFGSRMYDDFLGRWFTHDPMAEEYYPLSPYAYCGNNPVISIDTDGEFFWIVVAVVVIYAAVDYGVQVYNNYQKGYTGSKAWFGEIDFVDVALSGLAGGLSFYCPALIPYINYGMPFVKNAIDYTPNGQWKTVFGSGEHKITWKDYIIKTAIGEAMIGATDIFSKGMKTGKPMDQMKKNLTETTKESFVRENIDEITKKDIRNIVETAVSTSASGVLRTDYEIKQMEKQMEQMQKPSYPNKLTPNMKNRKKDISGYFNFDFSKIRNLFKIKTLQFQINLLYE
jgi:RHS repeat-associated protein